MKRLAIVALFACTPPNEPPLLDVLPASTLTTTGTTIWVGVESSAATADGAEDTPYLTVADALDVASAGDTIQLLPGNYTESVDLDVAVTVVGAPKYSASIRHGTTPWTVSASGVTLRGLRFEGTGSGIGVKCLANCTVESSIFEDFATGVYLYQADGATLRFNRFDDFTTGVFVYRATDSVWVHNNQLVGMGASSGVQAWDSEIFVFNNLLTGMLYPLNYRRYVSTSAGTSYFIDNLVTDAYRPILAYNASAGELYSFYNAFDTTAGVSGTVTRSGDFDSACGAPPGGWDAPFDWGFVASGDCDDAGFPYWADPDGSTADVGANGGPYASGEPFLAPPAHFRIGFVLVHDGTASSDGEDMIEDFRQEMDAVWSDATAGRGELIALGPYQVEWTSALSAAVAPYLDDLGTLTRARARLVAQEVIAAEGDVFDYLLVLDDDIASDDWSTGPKAIHTAAIKDVRYSGSTWLYDASHEFGSDGRLRGVGQVSSVAYWQSSFLYQWGYRTGLALHEAVGHNFGVGPLSDGVSTGHWSMDVLQPDGAYSAMYARPWEEKADGTWGLVSGADFYDDDRHFHPVMLYAMGALGTEEVDDLIWLEWDDGTRPNNGFSEDATVHTLPLADIQGEWGGIRRPYDFVLRGTIDVPDGTAGSPVTATVTVDSSLPRSTVKVQVTGTTSWWETVPTTNVGPETLEIELEPYTSGIAAGSYQAKVFVYDEDGNASSSVYTELLDDVPGSTAPFTVTTP